MLKKFLFIAFSLILSASVLWAQDDPASLPAGGELDGLEELTEETESWLTTQRIGNAPGMDQMVWWDEDFAWTHTFDVNCKIIHDAKLVIRAYDVDSGPEPGDEYDQVYCDGNYVGDLKGKNDQWSKTTFVVNPEWLSDGKLVVWIDIDSKNLTDVWCVEIDWSALKVHWDFAPPVADFIADATLGIDKLCVQFKNLSTCAKKFYWDFGDGTNSTEKHPSHCYYNPPHKHYTVSLTAYGCGGEDTMVKTDYITVRRSTQVAFAASQIAGIPGMEVEFTNNSGGLASHFIWDYGDGTTEEFQHNIMDKIHPKHIYAAEGEYNVMLKAWGQGGEDMLMIEKLIYVDEDFAPLTFETGSATEEGHGWEHAVDQDIISTNAEVIAENDDAWATFNFADESVRAISKVRIALNKACGMCFTNNLAKGFELLVSKDGINYEKACEGCCSRIHGDWETFLIDPPVEGKYLTLKLLDAQGKKSASVVLSEIQVFGSVVEMNGSAGMMSEVSSLVAVPTDFGLAQNYPNPFNPETTIRYQLPEVADVLLNVYNVQGRLIASLVNGREESGDHQIVWTGSDESGQGVAGGVYFYRMTATTAESKTYSYTRKMTFLK